MSEILVFNKVGDGSQAVKIPAFQAGVPGSNPGRRTTSPTLIRF